MTSVVFWPGKVYFLWSLLQSRAGSAAKMWLYVKNLKEGRAEGLQASSRKALNAKGPLKMKKLQRQLQKNLSHKNMCDATQSVCM